MTSPANIFLCGYRRIGKEVLQYIVEKNYNVAVFTHDKDTQVIDCCKEMNVWYTTESINKAELPFKPDYIASVYYAYIIKPHIIDMCRGKIFNVHPSLLPNHGGCSAIPWAIIDGDDVTGVTFHYIDKDIDTGNIILQICTQIEDTDTQLSLYERIMDLGIKMWPAAFELVKSGFSGIEQHGSFTQYHKRGIPFDGNIQDGWDLKQTERFIRAMYFPPLPSAKYDGKEFDTYKEFFRQYIADRR